MNLDFINRLSPEELLAAGVAVAVAVAGIILITIKLKRRKKPTKFRRQWRELQNKLPNKQNWHTSIAEADNLLHDALKRRKFKGKTTGEMLVKAEKLFTDKDEVWFGHKLRRKLDENKKKDLEKKEVIRALVGLRQGIKDLGAFDGKK